MYVIWPSKGKILIIPTPLELQNGQETWCFVFDWFGRFEGLKLLFLGHCGDQRQIKKVQVI